jgi:ribosomal protein S18 acetylase RimI-like enzyme
MTFTYRPADKEDSARLAELINMASDGVVEYLFHDLIPEMTPVQVVAHNLENDSYPHTFNSAIVAENENDVIGMALSYPSSYHQITDEMRAFFPAERLERFEDFYSARVENSLFLDALGVDASFRRQGIGTRLVELTKEKARKSGYEQLSLIAFADNAPALALYKLLGFEAVQEIKLEGNEFIPHPGGCVLLRCKLSTQPLA